MTITVTATTSSFRCQRIRRKSLKVTWAGARSRPLGIRNARTIPFGYGRPCQTPDRVSAAHRRGGGARARARRRAAARPPPAPARPRRRCGPRALVKGGLPGAARGSGDPKTPLLPLHSRRVVVLGRRGGRGPVLRRTRAPGGPLVLRHSHAVGVGAGRGPPGRR